ncbi:MAG: cytochrome P460 family protein [Acidiferrobacterales bacterium]
MQYLRQLIARAASLSTAVTLLFSLIVAVAAEPTVRTDIEMSGVSGDAQKPRRHFRLRNPAELSRDEAADLYELIRDTLKAGYGRSGWAVAAKYQAWRRHNTVPYRSLTHGNHYLNNYSNATAKAYGAFENAGTLPVGSIIAKDSFAVTESRGIVLGPLFLMEKMPPGFYDVTADWKFVQILADGTLLGETNGEGAERVDYCIGCHLAAERHDLLYFLPKDYRVSPSR